MRLELRPLCNKRTPRMELPQRLEAEVRKHTCPKDLYHFQCHWPDVSEKGFDERMGWGGEVF